MVATREDLTYRILVLAPIGRDASAAAYHLAESKLACVICAGLDDLNIRLREGAAAALVTEEALLQGLKLWRNGLPVSQPGRTFPSSSLRAVTLRMLLMHTDYACLRVSAMFRCLSGP